MQVRIGRPVVFVVLAAFLGVMGVAAAGCGKYSISNIRSAKAFQDANALYKKNDFKGAVPRYEDAITFNPELGFAYFFLGHSYESLYKPGKKGDPENDGYLTKAAGHYRTAIDKLKTTTDPREQMVRRYSFEYLIALYGPDKLNDFSQVEAVVQELIAADPNDPTAYRILAKVYSDQGRFDEAEAQYLKAINVAPRDAVGYQFLADFYNKQGDFAKTMDAWNRRAQVEPNNPEAWHMIGIFYQDKVFRDKKLPSKVAMDYTLKGIAAEDKALSLNPEYTDAVLYKNILLRMQALYERDPKVQKDLLSQADVLYKKADELKKKQAGAQVSGTDPAAAKKAGS